MRRSTSRVTENVSNADFCALIFRWPEPPLAFTEGFEALREYLADVYTIVNVNTIHCTGMRRGRAPSERIRASVARRTAPLGSAVPLRTRPGPSEGPSPVAVSRVESSDRRAKEHHDRVVGRLRVFCGVRRYRVRKISHL